MRNAGFSATDSTRALISREPMERSLAQEGTSPQVSGASRRRTSPDGVGVVGRTVRSKTAGTLTVGATL